MNVNFSNICDEEINLFYTRVGYNVRSKREEQKMTQLDVSLGVGIKSVAFYSNCESFRYGKHFNIEHIYKLAKLFKINPCELLK